MYRGIPSIKDIAHDIYRNSMEHPNIQPSPVSILMQGDRAGHRYIYICFMPMLFQVSPSPDQTNPQSGCLSDWLKHPSHLISVRFRLAYLPTYLAKGSGGWRREELGNPPGKGGKVGEGGEIYDPHTPKSSFCLCSHI